MRRLASLLGLAAVLSLVLATAAHAQGTLLFPGVTYSDTVQFTPHGPVVVHVVSGPRPVGLYRLTPVLSNGTVLGKETVTSMERDLSSQATTVGVNGDFFALANGRPSGIFMHDGVLVSPPNPGRSSVGIGLDGSLDIRRVQFIGTWSGLAQRRALTDLNQAPGANGVSLFTADWGAATPAIAGGSAAVVLSPFPPAAPSADLSAPVVSVVRNGPVAIAPGSAVLVARGSAATALQAEAPLGTTVTVRLELDPDWSTLSDAIGGGPVIVQNGKPVYAANEAFTTSQIAPRDPRTAVGQRADGSILLVTTDGRQPGYSVGMTTFELAQTLVRLGAVQAMALDSGGSTTMAFDGTLLNRPSDGTERPIADALLLLYTGVYAPPPSLAVVSPNGDGVDDRETLGFEVVRPSTVTVTLTAPNRTTASRQTASYQPGTYAVPFPPPPPPLPPSGQPPPGGSGTPADGRWTLAVNATDDQGLVSSATRSFTVNATLGFLRVPRTLLLPPRGRKLAISWTQTRPAVVRVGLETPDGVPLRTISVGRLGPGPQTVTWNGRQRNGKLAFGGRYQVAVSATNELGTVELDAPLVVRRITGS